MKVRISNDTRSAVPKADFDAIKEALLGASYDLSLVVAPAATLRRLNRTYREKDEATDILSFTLSDNEGEIYICPSLTRREGSKFGRNYENFFIYLFIHGCAHLKGYAHGYRMETLEAKIRRRFGI